MTCEYRTHQEGVVQEEMTVSAKGRKDSSLKIRLQAKIIGKSVWKHWCTSCWKEQHQKQRYLFLLVILESETITLFFSSFHATQ